MSDKEAHDSDNEDDVDEYLERTYGKDAVAEEKQPSNNEGSKVALIRRLSRQLSSQISTEFERRRRSSIRENLPQTTYGWAVFLSTISAVALRYELGLQKSLTCPPFVYGQVKEGPLKEIYQEMTKSDSSILRRNIQPSLFVGTRGALSSSAAYLLGGPPKSEHHIRFRETFTIPLDGTQIGVEWELPTDSDGNKSEEARSQEILHGPIRQPVVLILHGLNNHADFGYVRSMMRTCVARGWVAAGMNLRGCGGVRLKTPRSYNGAYTGDIRYVVQSIVGRLDDNSCIFLVGNSLGANLITKYLGEEGLSGSLPKAVAGGVALGNPLVMNSVRISLLWSPLMALGAKKAVLDNWPALKQSNDPNMKKALKKALMAFTLKDFDEALAPVFVRNKRYYPFDLLYGFDNALAYANDAASYKVVRHVPVPLLTLAAKDDMIVYHPSRTRLSYCLANPNVMWVETMCGGHLGWRESPPDKRNWGATASWADSAAADFIEATLKARRRQPSSKPSDFHNEVGNTIHIKERTGFAEQPFPRSRL